MIDNSKVAFKLNEDNAIHIRPWLGVDEHDNELEQLMILLLGIVKETGDIRDSIRSLKTDHALNSEVTSLYEEEVMS